MSLFRCTDEEKAYETSVYRIFDKDDRLLYIGCTEDVVGRISMHLALYSAMPGSELISRGYARHETEEYPTRSAARNAERAAIAAEAPWLNRHHNPTRWRRVAGHYQPVDVEAFVEVAMAILGPRPEGKGYRVVHDDYLDLLARAG